MRGRGYCIGMMSSLTEVPSDHVAKQPAVNTYLDRRSSRSRIHRSPRETCTRMCPAGTLRRRTRPHSTPCNKLLLMPCCSPRSSGNWCTGRFLGSGCETRGVHRGTCHRRCSSRRELPCHRALWGTRGVRLARRPRRRRETASSRQRCRTGPYTQEAAFRCL